MIPKPIKSITIEDIQILIDEKVSENKTLEYKEKVDLGPDGKNKEFLADISSFANTLGGYYIIGIKEKKGIPIDAPGIDIKNDDDEYKRRIHEMIQYGIRPRIQPPEIEIFPTNAGTGKKIVIIRIHQSWIKPHMVSFKNSNKYDGTVKSQAAILM